MIPKIIHYCWFGRGEKPELAQKCIASWKKYMPDYEIIEWNEDNFDIHRNGYTEMCYLQKKYAFLSDYVRLLVVEEHGGIYFDTDVEVLKSFDGLRNHKAFFGFENDQYIASGLGFGAEQHADVMKQMVDAYEPYLSGENGVTGCPALNTEAVVKCGAKADGTLQDLNGVVIYPKDYFNPLNNNTGVLTLTDNTYSIHWYSMSWGSRRMIVQSKVTRVFHRIFGEDCFQWLRK